MFEKKAEELIQKNIKLNKTPRETVYEAVEFGYKEGTEKAKEVLEGLMRFCRCFAQHHTEDIRYKEAEQFLKETEE